MKIAEFLSTISTPQIENNSLACLLLKKSNKLSLKALRAKDANI